MEISLWQKAILISSILYYFLFLISEITPAYITFPITDYTNHKG